MRSVFVRSAWAVCLAGCIGSITTPDEQHDSAVMLEDAGVSVSDATVLDAERPIDSVNDAESAPDSAARDAASDAAPDAARAEAGPSPSDAAAGFGCSGHSYLLCEDFESAAAGALPSGWSAVSGWNGGAALVTADQHHSGSKALASAIAASGQPRAGHSLSSLGAAAGKHWGRIFYKVKAPFSLPPTLDMPPSSVIHGTLVGLRAATESRVVDTVVNGQGEHQFLYNLPDDSCCGGSAYDYASYDDNWHCAEWYIDASTESFRFFFEGKEVGSIAIAGDEPRARIEPYTSIVLGWINYQTPKQPYYEVWLDDLALDDERVGCE